MSETRIRAHDLDPHPVEAYGPGWVVFSLTWKCLQDTRGAKVRWGERL